ncbi:ATP-binding protein [Allokutzneria sp. A3M-2-11 16]|uniref:sensor histidine kinase n=1 Tax=Allokutzneria sp. A3M-2-11 16 TaxID=2962043 RepID=UPI0020B8C035|nr:ATP-binding protein [Allokutzneria sp. A3M-2-11 16]MCP3803490.1 ATP-binding protein [Allokutzneria sp. A3M-2-11 16]
MKRWTIRLRLTVLCGGLVLGASAALLGLTYLFVGHSLDRMATPSLDMAPVSAPKVSIPALLADQRALVRAEALQSLLSQGAIAFSVVGTATVVLVWVTGARMLRPLRRITDTARQVAGRSLHERIALDGPDDEVKELADTFDAMLDRLDHSFDGQRRFVANASHELRTPLTLQRTLVEVAMRRRQAPPEVRGLGEALLVVNERQERLIEGLLTLAHSEGELVETERVDLAEIARRVGDQAGAEARAAGITLRFSLTPTPVNGHPVLLERAVQNLVDNGIRHNAADGGWVHVRCGPPGTLTISNTGAVIAADDLPQLFEPFRRLGADRLATGRGSGLGLSIVRSVAHAHGGDVEAQPRQDGGLTVSLTLPPGESAKR